jgi:hypothetical protein
MPSSNKIICTGTLRQVFICLRPRNTIPGHTVYVYTWQFKEATRLRIYNYVKTKYGKTKTSNNFNRSSVYSVKCYAVSYARITR